VNMFDTGKTRIRWLLCDKETMTMLNRFHRMVERHGRSDGQTDRFAISINIAHQYADMR